MTATRMPGRRRIPESRQTARKVQPTEAGAQLLEPGTPTLESVISRPGVQPVLLGGSRDPNAKLTLVLIDRYGPAFVIKVATTERAAQAVRREGDLLASLHCAGLGSFGVTVPRPIGYVDAEGLPGLVASAVLGRPMSVDYHSWRHTARPRRVRADFDAAGEWLSALQQRTAGAPRPVTLLSEALTQIEGRFGRQRKLRLQLYRASRRLAAQQTPRTAVHGDYWFGNLLASRGKVVGVVDWENGELSGEPLRDVARFAVSYSLYLDRHVEPGAEVPGHSGLRAEGWGPGLAYAAAPNSTGGWYPSLVRSFCESALRRLGADPACAPDLVLAGIADVAATADHPEFALAHLQLLLDVTAVAKSP